MQAGDRVGPYVLDREIAEGGMARVFEATSRESGQRVALKLPSIPPAGLSEEVAEQFRHEVQAMMRLKHPRIVPILDWGSSADGQLYLAMPLIDDRSLRELAGSLDDANLLSIFDQLLDALAYAHDRGVVHRDIKPRNLLVALDGAGRPQLYVTDFGIADVHGARADELERGRARGRPLRRRRATLLAL